MRLLRVIRAYWGPLAKGMALWRSVNLRVDTTTQDAENRARGVPNYLHQVVISPDGRTLLFATNGPFSIYPNIYRKLDYDPVADSARAACPVRVDTTGSDGAFSVTAPDSYDRIAPHQEANRAAARHADRSRQERQLVVEPPDPDASGQVVDRLVHVASSTSARISPGRRSFSLPRSAGTMQNVQVLLQPTEIDTHAA